MAAYDGMMAISKTFKALAIVAALICFAIAILGGVFGDGGSFIFILFSLLGVIAFFALWTPAWIIRKFIQ